MLHLSCCQVFSLLRTHWQLGSRSPPQNSKLKPKQLSILRAISLVGSCTGKISTLLADRSLSNISAPSSPLGACFKCCKTLQDTAKLWNFQGIFLQYDLHSFKHVETLVEISVCWKWAHVYTLSLKTCMICYSLWGCTRHRNKSGFRTSERVDFIVHLTFVSFLLAPVTRIQQSTHISHFKVLHDSWLQWRIQSFRTAWCCSESSS